MLCNCESGKEKRPLFDARGIFCIYVCNACEEEKRKIFRPEIFEDSEYEHAGPFDSEDEFSDHVATEDNYKD